MIKDNGEIHVYCALPILEENREQYHILKTRKYSIILSCSYIAIETRQSINMHNKRCALLNIELNINEGISYIPKHIHIPHFIFGKFGI